MRSKGVNLGPTGRKPIGAGVGAAAPKLVYATPYKVLRNLINYLRRDPNRLCYLYYN